MTAALTIPRQGETRHADRTPACRRPGINPEMFFPHPLASEAVQAAKAVCATCPVTDACLAEAMANPRLVGIWGGTTQYERWPESADETCGTWAGVSRHKRAGQPLCEACRDMEAERQRKYRANRAISLRDNEMRRLRDEKGMSRIQIAEAFAVSVWTVDQALKRVPKGMAS